MSTPFNILTLFAVTALVEMCVLRAWSKRRGYLFCVMLVAAISGILWTVFYFNYLEVANGPSLPRPANTTPNVGSGDDWMIVMFFIYAVIIGAVAMIPAGITALIYGLFRKD